MQPYRITARTLPRVYKAPTPSRTMFTAPFFPHYGNVGNGIAPLFSLLDHATSELVPVSLRQIRRSFAPRFDVREVNSAYELQGELPGIEQKDLEIEFVDERTLVIRGRTATESTSTTDNKTAEAAEPTKAIAKNQTTSDNVSEKEANYQRASVEDEYVDAAAETSDDGHGIKTPASPAVEATPASEQKKAAEPSLNYWVSERSTGAFERRFSFPGRVEQDAVKASLRNGILSVVVPKVVAREVRKINIE